MTTEAALFTLYAPGKESVCVIGDFNGWKPGADPLEPNGQGGWVLEKRLPRGTYAYQFLVDGRVAVSDPLARAVVRGPAGGPPCAVVEVGAEPFAWRNDGWTRPAFGELVIYELHVGDFSPEASFQGVQARLDHLAALGVNAIELMPIYDFAGENGGDEAWGYDPMHLCAVHAAYGSAANLKALIDEAHGRGIAVILDMVLAHTAHEHPFAKLYPVDNDSPWFGESLGEQNRFGFPSFDYRKPATEHFARAVLTYWLTEFHVDGFRFDYCLGLGRNERCGMPFLTAAARAVQPSAYLIAEYLPEKMDQLHGCGFDGAWHGRMKSALYTLLSESEYRNYAWQRFAEAVHTFDAEAEGYGDTFVPVNFVESHDEPRLSCLLQEEGGFGPKEAQAKALLAAVVLLTTPGVPMLYQGQEWGEATARRVNRRNSLHWQRLESEAGMALYQHFAALIRLRREHPALHSGALFFAGVDEERKLVVYRLHASGDDLLVAANFGLEARPLPLRLSAVDGWRRAFEAEAPDAGVAKAGIAPYSAAVYVRTR